MFPPFCARQSASYPKNLFSRFLKKSFILSDFRKAQLFLKTKNEFPAITWILKNWVNPKETGRAIINNKSDD